MGVEDCCAELNTLLVQGAWATALQTGGDAWNDTIADAPPPENDVDLAHLLWFFLGLAEAHYQAGDYEGSLAVLSSLVYNYTQQALNTRNPGNGLVIGNVWFHLRASQCKWHLASVEDRNDQGPGSPIDELTRAVTSAGFQILHGEDQAFKDLVEAVLTPPEGSNNWTESMATYSHDAISLLKEFPYCHAPSYFHETLAAKLKSGEK